MIPLPSGAKIWLVAGIKYIRNGFNCLATKVQTTLKTIRCPATSSSSGVVVAVRSTCLDHLQAQLDKLSPMNCGSRSEKVSRHIAQMKADLNLLQKESDTLMIERWVRVSASSVVRLHPGIRPQNYLAGFRGVLLEDAYAGFNELYCYGQITEAACCAHARHRR